MPPNIRVLQVYEAGKRASVERVAGKRPYTLSRRERGLIVLTRRDDYWHPKTVIRSDLRMIAAFFAWLNDPDMAPYAMCPTSDRPRV